MASLRREALTKFLTDIPLSVWAWPFALAIHGLYFSTAEDTARIIGAPLILFLGAWVACRERPVSESLTRNAAIFVTVVQALFGILQLFNRDPIFTREIRVGESPFLPAGFSGHHTIYGVLMAWLMLYWLFRRNWAFAVLCGLMAITTKSAFCVAAVFVGSLWWVWCTGYKKSAMAIGSGAALAAIFLFQSSLDSKDAFLFSNGRLEVWIMAMKAWRDRPWFGYGLGAFARDFARYHQGLKDVGWREAHNELLEYLFNTGILGMLFLLPLFYSVGYRLWRIPRSKQKDLAAGTILIIGADAMGSFPLQLAPLLSLALFSVAWVFVEFREKCGQSGNEKSRNRAGFFWL